MTHLRDRQTRLREMSRALDIALSETEISSLSHYRYVFIGHSPGNSDKSGAIDEYFLNDPEGGDDFDAIISHCWATDSEMPIPAFVIDLDAERPLIEVDEPHSTKSQILLLKRRYGPGDRHRVDQRVRRRIWGRLRREARHMRDIGWHVPWQPWLELDYETFWAKGGWAGISEWMAKHPYKITSPF